MKKYLGLLVILAGLMVAAAGCWDQIELDKRAIITAVGIDQAEEAGKITLTFQTIIPGRLSGTLGDSPKESAVRVVSASGATILEAIRHYQQQTDAIPYFPHNRLLVIGEALARRGVKPIIDYFIRNLESQPRAWVLIAKTKAADILQWRTAANQIPANYIADLLYCSSRQAITAFATADIHHFVLALSTRSTSPATSGIEVVTEAPGRPPEIRIFGTAVFKRDKLAGWLGMRETRGLLWITSQSMQGILESDAAEGQRRDLVQQVTRSHSQITPLLTPGGVAVRVTVEEEGNIGEQDGGLMLTAPGMIRSLERSQSAAMKAEIESCLRQCQGFGADIFGFGTAIERRFPKEWRRLAPRWDREFARLKVSVDARARIRGSGIITDPVHIQ